MYFCMLCLATIYKQRNPLYTFSKIIYSNNNLTNINNAFRLTLQEKKNNIFKVKNKTEGGLL